MLSGITVVIRELESTEAVAGLMYGIDALAAHDPASYVIRSDERSECAVFSEYAGAISTYIAQFDCSGSCDGELGAKNLRDVLPIRHSDTLGVSGRGWGGGLGGGRLSGHQRHVSGMQLRTV